MTPAAELEAPLDWQLQFLNDVTRIAAAFGLVGAVATVYAYHKVPYFNIPTAKVIYFLSFGYFIEAICKYFGPLAVAAGATSVLCQLDAFLITFSNLFSVIWMFFIAFVLFLVMLRGWTAQRAGVLHVPFFLMNVIASFALSAPLIWWDDADGMPMYGTNESWCWVSSYHPVAEMLLMHTPMIAGVLLDMAVIMLVTYRIWNHGSTQNMELNMHTRNYAYATSAYLVFFVFTWLPGFLNRLHYFASGGESDLFPLLVVRSVFTPIRGLLAFLLYVHQARAYEMEVRETERACVKRGRVHWRRSKAIM